MLSTSFLKDCMLQFSLFLSVPQLLEARWFPWAFKYEHFFISKNMSKLSCSTSLLWSCLISLLFFIAIYLGIVSSSPHRLSWSTSNSTFPPVQKRCLGLQIQWSAFCLYLIALSAAFNIADHPSLWSFSHLLHDHCFLILLLPHWHLSLSLHCWVFILCQSSKR